MPAGPRRLALFLLEKVADRDQILGKEKGRGQKNKNGQEYGDSAASLRESHNLHTNRIISDYILYKIYHENRDLEIRSL